MADIKTASLGSKLGQDSLAVLKQNNTLSSNINNNSIKPANILRILFYGDLIGDPGRKAYQYSYNGLKNKYNFDFVIINGENLTHGFGIMKKNLVDILNLGVNTVTTGNHVFQKKEIFDFIDEFPELLRPLNYPKGTPGNGIFIKTLPDNIKLAVISLMGRTYMDAIDCPFQTLEKAVNELKEKDINIIFIDFHAEATGEKQLLGRLFDGKVSAVIGTHTHVQTADERIFPNGTAYMSDAGMCGTINSVLGMKFEEAHRRSVLKLPVKYSPEEKGPLMINAVLVDINKSNGKAVSIIRIKEEYNF